MRSTYNACSFVFLVFALTGLLLGQLSGRMAPVFMGAATLLLTVVLVAVIYFAAAALFSAFRTRDPDWRRYYISTNFLFLTGSLFITFSVVSRYWTYLAYPGHHGYIVKATFAICLCGYVSLLAGGNLTSPAKITASGK